MKKFSDLTEQEVLALAITNEEEDSRIYRGFAEGLREQFPSSAKVFDEMAEEEVTHRTWLFDLYRKKFGDYLPLIRRQDVKGFIHHKSSLWLMRPLGLEDVRKFAENMEYEAERYYRKAAETARDASVRELLVKLAEAEAGHESLAHKLGQRDPHQGRAREGGRDGAAHVRAAIRAAGPRRPDGRLGVDAGAAVRRGLRHPQYLGDLPGRHGRFGRRRHLHGLCRGAVRRRLAHRARHALAARHGVRPDDRDRRARSHSALPHPALLDRHGRFDRRGRDRTGDISWIRYRYMDTPFLQAAFQVVVGGVLVFLAGILIGSS